MEFLLFPYKIYTMKNKTEKVRQVEKLLEFTIVIGMFYPVLMEALFGFGEREVKDISHLILNLGAFVFMLILNYLVFFMTKHKLGERSLRYLVWIYFSAILCVALVFLLLSLVDENITGLIGTLLYHALAIVFNASLYLPLVGFLVIIFTPFLQSSRLPK